MYLRSSHFALLPILGHRAFIDSKKEKRPELHKMHQTWERNARLVDVKEEKCEFLRMEKVWEREISQSLWT